MLTELVIRDLALIEEAALELGAGLNVVTGETGAGKSLLIDALEFLLGGRARGGLVRAGAERARVEGRFVLSVGERQGYAASVLAWLGEELPEALEEAVCEEHPGEIELILSRSLAREGRSRAHVNHRPVTQTVLRQLASRLVEVHGQNDHQRLLDPLEQLRLLDDFGGLEDAVEGYRERRARWLALEERRADFDRDERARGTRIESLRHQASELVASAPLFEKHEELVRERDLLRHAEALGSELGAVVQRLSEDETPLLVELGRAADTLETWSARVPGLSEAAQGLREASAWAEEAAGRLRSFQVGIEVSPQRLEEVEEGLAEIARLERKHDRPAAELKSRRAEVESELEQLEQTRLGREDLEQRTLEALRALAESGTRLARARRALRPRLKRAATAGLSELGLARASFEVAFDPHLPGAWEEGEAPALSRRRFGVHGTESIELRLAANPGEEPGPLRAVASGGEVARIMLALRGALAVRRSTPTLVFDEVDAGVGGRLGPKVGAHLKALSERHQVLCVTHLPAIAAVAHRHLRVSKKVRAGRTRTAVRALKGETRVQEIADMIAGGADQATARAEARRLLESAH